MEEKKYCPKCGHEFVQGESDYNYETAETVYTCHECDWEGTGALDRDRIKEDLAEELGEEWEVEEKDVDNVLDTIQFCESYEEAMRTVAEEIKKEEREDDEDNDDLSDKLESYDGSYNKRELKKNGLCIVTWPDSQALCEMENFWEHAWLINDDYGLRRFGSCAYVVEEEWYNNE